MLNGADRAKHMEVRVWYAAVLPVWLVYGEVNHHAPAHKVFLLILGTKKDRQLFA